VNYYPPAKIGSGNYVYVWSGGSSSASGSPDGQNYFGISAISSANTTGDHGELTSSSDMTVAQAYSIDKKMDDGFPQTGRVMAGYLNNAASYPEFFWAANGSSKGASPGASAAASATSCYDNGGSASSPMAYSLGQNSGAGVNCALSFQFQ
jgi:hypothetical protein